MAEYIERKEVLWLIYSGKIRTGDRAEKSATTLVNSIPATDVRPVVLCKDCEYWQSDCGWCGYFDIGMNIDDFCSRGKKEES